MGYYPFGGCRNSTGDLATDRLFTGQRLDETGLYFYNARYYDATIGRFISADIIISNPANPQCFNLYSYCLNNPLKYIDPSGYDAIGHCTVGNETYFIEEENGQYRVIGSDLSVSAWYDNYNDLVAEWIWQLGRSNGEGSWVTWEKDESYSIPIYDKELDAVYTINLVPDSSFRAKYLVGKKNKGISIIFLGAFVRYEYSGFKGNAFGLVQTIRHEWWHEYENKTQRNAVQDLKMIIGGNILFENFYGDNPQEVHARIYAHQNPDAWGHSKPRGFFQKFLDLFS